MLMLAEMAPRLWKRENEDKEIFSKTKSFDQKKANDMPRVARECFSPGTLSFIRGGIRT